MRFYSSPNSIVGNKLKVEGENFHYLKDVLRIEKGGHVSAFDGTGKEYFCVVDGIHPRRIDLHITRVVNVDRESSAEICLAQCLIKTKYFEFVIQKCTELGVRKFIPVSTERTVLKLKGQRAKDRVLRWQKIAREAARQCGRSFCPAVSHVTDFGNALQEAGNQDISIIPWEEEQTTSLREVLTEGPNPHFTKRGRGIPRKVMVFIGPEGGFTREEISSAKKHGVIPVSLGSRVLRSETAAIATVAILIHELG